MQTLNREDVFKVLDHAGFNPEQVVVENYSPYPGADGVALRVNRDAVARIAESAEILDEQDELTSPLPISELSSVMLVDQTGDLIYFDGFQLSPASSKEDDDPRGDLPPFLRELFKEARPAGEGPGLDEAMKSLKDSLGQLAEALGSAEMGPHGEDCQCLTSRERRVADLASSYREMAQASNDLKSVAMMDAILAELDA